MNELNKLLLNSMEVTDLNGRWKNNSMEVTPESRTSVTDLNGRWKNNLKII